MTFGFHVRDINSVIYSLTFYEISTEADLILSLLKIYVCVCQGCIKCHPECRTCFGQGLSFCLSCVHYEQEEKCVLECGSDYYVDGSQCQRCDSHCLQCTGPSDMDCINCKQYKYYLPSDDSSRDNDVANARVCIVILFVMFYS